MNAAYVRSLRQLARDMLVPAALVQAGLDCGLFRPGDSLDAGRRALRQARRLMLELGVNPAGAALLLRMRRDMEALHAEMEWLRRRRAVFSLDEWLEGVWRELDS